VICPNSEKALDSGQKVILIQKVGSLLGNLSKLSGIYYGYHSPDQIMKLKVLQDTFFKQSIADSSKLSPDAKVRVTAGAMYEVHSWKAIEKDHLRIAMIDDFIGTPPRNTWTVYAPHVKLINVRGETVTPHTANVLPRMPDLGLGLPKTKRLNIPYHTQLNNALNPMGACNVTCYAMVMRYFQIQKRTNAVQFEDELYRYLESRNLSRHDPGDLAQMGRDYGLNVDLTLRGSLMDIRRAIAQGKPCIVHGYLTSFGHIIVIRGYDRKGFFVNDPFGEWFDTGYRNDLPGENLHYSNRLIQSKCSPEGANYLWLHRISKA